MQVVTQPILDRAYERRFIANDGQRADTSRVPRIQTGDGGGQDLAALERIVVHFGTPVHAVKMLRQRGIGNERAGQVEPLALRDAKTFAIGAERGRLNVRHAHFPLAIASGETGVDEIGIDDNHIAATA